MSAAFTTKATERLVTQFEQYAATAAGNAAQAKASLTSVLDASLMLGEHQGMEAAQLGARFAGHSKAHRLYLDAAAAVTIHDDPSELVNWATALLLAGADDEWSGRGNDARRVVFDHVKVVAENVLRAVRFEAERANR